MPPKLTPYAQKFGLKAELSQRGRSGLTPINPDFPNLVRNSPEFILNQKLENYQREVLMGYTSRELLDLDCISSRSLRLNNLDCEIDPLFGRDRWETARSIIEGPFVGNERTSHRLSGALLGTTGQIDWLVSNDVIWEVLKPSLKMATIILGQLPNHPWFDAFLMSPRVAVEASRLPQEYIDDHTTYAGPPSGCKVFSVRSPLDSTQTRAKMKQLINDVFKPRLTFGFMSRHVNPFTGAKQQHNQLGAAHWIEDRFRIWISRERVVPLFRTDLTDSERLSQQWLIATIIMHELAHALHRALVGYDGPIQRPDDPLDKSTAMEPYFEEEQTSEIGFSINQALFGGTPTIPVNNVRQGAPSLAFFSTWFPSGMEKMNSKMPYLIPPPGEQVAFPIPVTYFENLGSEEYWASHAIKYGIASTLKPDRSITASYLGKDSNGANLKWRVFSDEATDKARWTRHDKNSVEALSSLSPQQRHDHATLMKRDLIASYQPLTIARDKLVSKIIDLEEKRNRTDSQDPTYPSLLQDLFGANGKTADLIQQHKNIVDLLPKLEEAAGAQLPEIRRGIWIFHHHGLTTWLSSHVPNIEMIRESAQVLLTALRNIRRETPFLQAWVPPPAAVAIVGHRAPYPIAVVLQDAMANFQLRDVSSGIKRCNEVINSFIATPLERARAMELLEGNTPDNEMSTRERIDILSKIRKIYQDIPEKHVAVQQLGLRISALEQQFHEENRTRGCP